MVSRPAVLHKTLMQCPAPQYLEEEGLDIKTLIGLVLDREHELVVEACDDLCGRLTESSSQAVRQEVAPALTQAGPHASIRACIGMHTYAAAEIAENGKEAHRSDEGDYSSPTGACACASHHTF